MLRNHGRPPFLPGLGGLRSLATLAVLCGHTIAWLTPLPNHPLWYAPVGRLTEAGLAGFFVLSGFVLQYNYGPGPGRDRLRPGRFALARLSRIYPVYLLLLVVALVGVARQAPWAIIRFPGNVLVELALLQSWIFTPEVPSNFPLAWAVSTEAFFYLVFPALTWLLTRTGGKRGALAMGLAAVAAAVALDLWITARWPSLFAWVAARHPGFNDAPEALAGMLFPWLTYTCPYLRLFDFLVGMAAARYLVLGGRIPRGLGLAAGLGLLFALIIPRPQDIVFLSVLENNILYAPFLAAMSLVLATRPPAWATSRTSLRLGAASLAIYLAQPWSLAPWKTLAQSGFAPRLAAIAAGTSLTIAAGLALTRFVEAPLSRRLRALAKKKEKAEEE